MWGSGRPQAGQARDRLHPISRTCPGLGALRELSHLNASFGLCRQLALLSAHISSTHTPRGGGGRGEAEGLLSSSAQPPLCSAGVPESPGFQPCFCYCP